mmetsp:Transcript_54504/g.151950  ORF Transcript_54504/g.151950 Transcript_54504/m.151950 type:complete len:219 (-) Transcript_54504:115-771(-)
MAAVIAPPLENDEELQKLYVWVDEIPLSRPKRNISRDFADGVLFAEIINHFFPRLIEMHNYSAANSAEHKKYNWNTLNTRVLKKIGYTIHQDDIDEVTKALPGAIERVLVFLQDRVAQIQNGTCKVARPTSRASVRPSAVSPAEFEESDALVGKPPLHKHQQEAVDMELLVEKEETINELREMVGIMSEKIKKLEQLMRIKDSKIEALTSKLAKFGVS